MRAVPEAMTTKAAPSSRPKAKTPRGRRGVKTDGGGGNKATTSDFEREDMGIAAKE